MVGNGEVQLVNAKIKAIQEYPAPTTKKDLMHFLFYLVGYYRSFCPNFLSFVAPLTDLLKTKAKFLWSSNCVLSFENVKYLLCSSAVLAAPCLERFSLHVNINQVGAGIVLQQADEQGVVHPVSFISSKFNSYQLNYSVVE